MVPCQSSTDSKVVPDKKIVLDKPFRWPILVRT
jgi:hypothetical protein